MEPLTAEAQKTADNIISLGSAAVPPPNFQKVTPSAEELEEKRKLVVRAFQIVAQHYERDAQKMLESAVVNEIPPEERIKRMLMADALYKTLNWTRTMYLTPEK